MTDVTPQQAAIAVRNVANGMTEGPKIWAHTDLYFTE